MLNKFNNISNCSHINNEYLKLAMHLNNWHHIKYFIKPDAVGFSSNTLVSKASFKAIEDVSQLNHKTCTLPHTVAFNHQKGLNNFTTLSKPINKFKKVSLIARVLIESILKNMD
ncbi:hypothetical protein ACJX0J_018475, partial [Zea mays]